MRDAFRAELLKASSGFWMLAMLTYTLLLPFVAWSFTGRGVAPDAGSATKVMLGFLAVCPIAATFLGCYLVTREYYYRSIERSVLMHRKEHVFGGKLVAGAAAGLVVGIVGTGGWTAFTVFVLDHRGQAFDLGARTWQALVGCVVACVLACVLGVAIGWILPNYYAATSVALMVPFVLELPLVTLAPHIARFLPNSALAGLAQAPFPGLFGAWPSGLVVLVWLAFTVFLAWRRFEHRESQ